MKKGSIKALIAKVIAAIYGCLGIIWVVLSFAFIPMFGKEPFVWVFSLALLLVAALLIIVTYKVIFRYSAGAIKGLSALIGLTVFTKISAYFGPVIDKSINAINQQTTSGPLGVSISTFTAMISPFVLIIIPVIVYKISYYLLRPEIDK